MASEGEGEAWSFKAGKKGANRVRAFEDPKRGILVEYYEDVRDPETGQVCRRRQRVSLGWAGRDAGEAKARELADAFESLAAQHAAAAAGAVGGPVTIGKLFDIYGEEVTPTKSRGKQGHDRACMELFTRFLLPEVKEEARARARAELRRLGQPAFRWARALPLEPGAVNWRRLWDRFIRERASGQIAPRGARKVKGKHGRVYPQVGMRVIGYDLKFLRALFTWATVAGEDRNAFLDRNPLAGLKVPTNPSPARPVADEDEYRAMLNAVERIPPRAHKRGKSEIVPTQAELARRRLQLVILNEAGHRGSSVRRLQWSDFQLSAGRVRWAGEFDKQRKEHWTTLSAEVVEEIRRARAIIGEIRGWVFPSPLDPREPMSRSAFAKWFREAAITAGAWKPRLGAHSMRRKAATEMECDPAVAAAALGMSVTTYLQIYKQPTEEQQRAAQASRRPLRATGTA